MRERNTHTQYNGRYSKRKTKHRHECEHVCVNSPSGCWGPHTHHTNTTRTISSELNEAFDFETKLNLQRYGW